MRRSILGLTLCLAPALAGAAGPVDPDWPCVQRKVVELSVAQMWPGPPIPDAAAARAEDPEIRDLAARLALRRVPLEEADAMVASFADGLAPGEERVARLAGLFLAAFEIIQTERLQIIGGIARYARNQQKLTGQLDSLRAEQSALLAVAEPSFDQQDRIEELEDLILWETRVFQDRQQSLTYVCEAPVLMEQRAFGLARAIAGRI